MHILVFGIKGQLGWELQRQNHNGIFKLTGVDLPEVDLTDKKQVQVAIDRARPDIMINAAAYTQVDQAESDPKTAFAVNQDGPANLAELGRSLSIPLLHVSTDFVFNGRQQKPYTEKDAPDPISVYAQSKAGGEKMVAEILSEHLIVRTAWLYGVHGANFVKTILRAAKEHEYLKVVDDQYGCPTSAADLAATILTMIAFFSNTQAMPWGFYHYCGQGVTTWHGFAKAVVELGKKFTPLKTVRIDAITSAEYPLPAHRPAYSAMDCTLIKTKFGVEQKPWQESLHSMLTRLYQK